MKTIYTIDSSQILSRITKFKRKKESDYAAYKFYTGEITICKTTKGFERIEKCKRDFPEYFLKEKQITKKQFISTLNKTLKRIKA